MQAKHHIDFYRFLFFTLKKKKKKPPFQCKFHAFTDYYLTDIT